MDQENKKNPYKIKVESAKITFPNGKTFDIEIVSQKGELPYDQKRQVEYENYINGMRALPDFQFWNANLKADIKKLERDIDLSKALVLTKGSRNYTVTLRVERNTDLLFLDANHWYESLENTGFPKATRQQLRAITSEELKTTVRHLRNLREHQKDVHFYFNSTKPVPDHKDLKSVRWFKEKYPKANPWSLFYPGGDAETRVAGVFRLSELKAQIQLVETVINGR